MKKALNIIVMGLSVVSMVTIVVLVFFADTIFKVDSSSNVITVTTKSINVSFDTDPLILDGTDLNLMQGVTATNDSGEDVINLIDASVVNDNEHKLVMYSVNDSNYNLETFERGLQLKNYNGPSIAIKNTTYTCDINEIDTYISQMIEAKYILAKDGFGNDISSNVYVDPSVQVTKVGKQKITLIVKNSFADSVKKNITITVTGKLKENKVTLSTETTTVKKGNTFSPEKYVAVAVNGDGEDISDQIVYDNQVDVNTPGRYSVYYYVAEEENAEPVATLSVVVTE